jgi:hypothetical protein
MIRRATSEDMPQILDLARRFHAYSPWSVIPCDDGAIEAFAASLIENGVILLTDDGMCGGAINPLYFSPSFTIGIEFFWFAPSGDNGLRAAFEAWCRERGAVGVQFSALADDHLPAVARLYRRAGFEPAETAFVKRF